MTVNKEGRLPMKEKKPSLKAFCTVIAICIFIAFSNSIFADNYTAPAPETNNKTYEVNHKQYLEKAIADLVQEGKLSKGKAEKILEYKRKKEHDRSELTGDQKKHSNMKFKKGSLLGDLRRDNILTDTEVQLIREKLREMKDARLADRIQILIEKNVLTQEDVNNMSTYMAKVREERKAQIEKMLKMNPDERKEYFESIKKERKDIITRMVEDKVITKEQATEIRRALPELRRSRIRKPN